jgi:hypothetical protein
VKFLFKHSRTFARYFANERGSVESALVIIPLLILFLLSAQLIVATNMRTLDMAMTQSQASQRAISGVLYASDEVIDLKSPDAFEHIRILVTHRSRVIPQLLPNLIAMIKRNPRIDVSGVAVMENLS